MNPWLIRRTVDLLAPNQLVEQLGILAFTGDNQAHRLELTIREGQKTASLSGMTVRAYFYHLNGDQMEELPHSGSLSGNTILVTFPALAYQMGKNRVVVKLEATGISIPVYAGAFRVQDADADVLLDPDDVVMNLPELLAQIEACKNATTAAQQATTAANQGEANRVNAENKRVTAEQSRASAEQNRVTAEQNRASAEQSRATAEGNRAKAESSRATTESGRVSAESSRVSAENRRVTAEQNRASAEGSRVTAEQNRVSAESQRAAAENARAAAESDRQSEHQAAQAASETQTDRAKEAADKLSAFELDLETLPPSADPSGSVEQTANKTIFHMGIPASNFAYATFWINPATRKMMMRIPDGFSALTFLIQNRRLVVRING